MSLATALSDDTMDLLLRRIFHSGKLRTPQNLGRSLVSLAFALAAAQMTHASQNPVTVNNTGTLFAARDSQVISSPQGALTMDSPDVLTPNAPKPQIAVVETAPMGWAIAPTSTSYAAEPTSLVSFDRQFLPSESIAGDGVIQFNDVTPAPEASTWLAGLLAAGAAAFSQRHRFALRSGRTHETTYWPRCTPARRLL